MKAPVNKIIPMSVVDGPGNRTAVFLQGCNISCAYCHNPETQNLCTGCGICAAQCPAGALRQEGSSIVWDEHKCASCDTCIAVCPNYASPKVKAMTAAQVLAEVEKNLPFIRGITVSGGECMLYPDFLRELFRGARELGLSCLIDSNGTIPFDEATLAVCDGVMLDVKSWDPQIFQALTGGSNTVVKRNLRLLSEKGKLTEVRLVYVPGMVDAEAVLRGIAETVSDKQQFTLKLIRFRPFGVRGALSEAPSPSDGEMASLRHLAEELGFPKIRVT